MDQMDGTLWVRSAGTEFAGRVFHRRGLEIEVEFKEPGLPALPITEAVELALGTADVKRQKIRARTTAWYECIRGCVYHFQVRPEHEAILTAMLLKRRGARVKPTSPYVLDVLMQGREAHMRVRGSIHDVSETGIGVRITGDEAHWLCAARQLELSFELPGDPRRIEIRGFVRSRRMLGTTLCYGLQFDDSGTPDVETQRELIHRWLRRQQIAQLQRC